MFVCGEANKLIFFYTHTCMHWSVLVWLVLYAMQALLSQCFSLHIALGVALQAVKQYSSGRGDLAAALGVALHATIGAVVKK